MTFPYSGLWTHYLYRWLDSVYTDSASLQVFLGLHLANKSSPPLRHLCLNNLMLLDIRWTCYFLNPAFCISTVSSLSHGLTFPDFHEAHSHEISGNSWNSFSFVPTSNSSLNHDFFPLYVSRSCSYLFPKP